MYYHHLSGCHQKVLNKSNYPLILGNLFYAFLISLLIEFFEKNKLYCFTIPILILLPPVTNLFAISDLFSIKSINI